MHAIGLVRRDGTDGGALVDLDLPQPEPSAGDLLVDVRAVAVNPLDLRARRRPPAAAAPPRILGWDAAGVVVATGASVSDFRVGDSVYYAGEIGRPGAYAQRHVVDARLVGHMPASLDFAQAAALPLTTLTAWEALFDRMRIPEDASRGARSLLLIGAAGGVGSMAVQLAAGIPGMTVIGTASREASAAWVHRLGAHHVVDHARALPAQLDALGLPAVDHVLLLQDADAWFPVASEIVAPEGGIGLVAELTRSVDLGALWDRSVTVAWEMVFTRTEASRGDRAAQGRILDEVARRIDRGELRSTLTSRISGIAAASIERAHRMLAQRRQLGKIVLEGWGGAESRSP